MEAEKKSIGKPDQNRVNKLVRIFDKVISLSNDIKWGLDKLLIEHESVPISDFIEFVKSKDPALFLSRKFVSVKKISVPGISSEALISSNLIDLPKEETSYLLADHAEFIKLIQLLKDEGYCMPVTSFYNSEDNIFEMDEDLTIEKINLDLSVYTESEKENTIVEKLELAAEVINDLVELGVLPADHRCLNVGFFLNTAFKIDRRSNRPVTLSQIVFTNQRIKPLVSNTKIRKSASFDLNKFLS